MRILAVDQGTTSTRALLTGIHDEPRVVHSVRHAQHYPQPGWVEHDPLELLRHVETCLAVEDRIDAIGLANQGESCLAWDSSTGEPLSPVIVWQDRRTQSRIEALRTAHNEKTVERLAGLPLDPYFSASKLAWLIETLPAVAAARDQGRLRLGTTDAFLLERLTGRFVTDVTTASRTSLMNLETRSWDAELCALFGVPIDCLPVIVPTLGEVIGTYRGIPVSASVVDQQAALFGHGCRTVGAAKVTFGTGAFALALTGESIIRDPARGLLPTVAWSSSEKTTYAVDGGVYDAGSVVEWLLRSGMADSIDELCFVDGDTAASKDLFFIPALSGLACPYWDRSAGSLWIGMTPSTGRLDLCQSALEGIAFCIADVVETVDRALDVPITVSVDGGLTRNSYFLQFLSDLLGRELHLQHFDELTSWGTASMAAVTFGATLRPADGDIQIVRPRPIPRESWRNRFAEAVRRSRGWQRD